MENTDGFGSGEKPGEKFSWRQAPGNGRELRPFDVGPRHIGLLRLFISAEASRACEGNVLKGCEVEKIRAEEFLQRARRWLHEELHHERTSSPPCGGGEEARDLSMVRKLRLQPEGCVR